MESLPLDVVIELVSEDGVLYNLLGIFTTKEGVRYCQISRGEMLSLVPPEQLMKLGIKEVWQFKIDTTKGIPITIGDNVFVVDKICHNFGEIPPLANLSCSFDIVNQSEKTMIIEPPLTSCGCVATFLDKYHVLEPGGTFQLNIELESGTASSFRQTVMMRLHMEETGEAKSFDLFLVGSHPSSMEVSPNFLNFGVMLPGERSERDVVLKEVATDRFSIIDVKSDIEYLSWETKSEIASDDLNNYRIHVTLEIPIEFDQGAKYVGELLVKTNSNFLPEITIPVTFEAPPYITAVPSVISFGTVKAGVSASAKVTFVARDGLPVTPKFVKLPDTITAAIDKEYSLLTFTPASDKTGVLEESVEVEVVSEKKSERLVLKCTALAL
jgi:hypothetical protein